MNIDKIYNTDIHESFMSRAIEIAKLGRGCVSPNPMVGCVLVKEGEIIGEGYHQKYGDPHAEVMAIRNSRKNPLDSIAYINLEPCSFIGKTPACTDTLKENGISEVYIGMLDPNPMVNGRGVKELERSGIRTHIGILSEEAAQLNQSFTKWITQGLPYVIAKVAQSNNGYMGIDSNSTTGITSLPAKKHTHSLRSQVDAILVGRQTALIDNPQLNVREVKGQNPKRIILDTYRKLPLNLKVFNDKNSETIVLCSADIFEKSKTHFCKYIPVEVDDLGLSVKHILKALAEEGITSLLVEGGHSVLKSFFLTDEIDKLYIYTSPHDLKEASLKNPLSLSKRWSVLNEKILGDDSLIIAEKEVECLQEL